MKISNPKKVRQLYAEKMKWLTVEEIAAGLKMSTRTVSKAFNGGALRPATVKRFSGPLGMDPTEIATFMN